MIKTPMFISALVAAGLLVGTQDARAHCDAVDGPVAIAAQKALEGGNVNPVLAYAPAAAETEILASFEKSRKVRGLSTDVRAIADQAFMETVIRLHRAGEGAAYTGLRSGGADYGPAIPAAEDAVETGDVAKLKGVLSEEIERALRQRLAHVQELQKKASREPETVAEVPQARERISAELGFVTFAEVLRQAALGKGAEHHVD